MPNSSALEISQRRPDMQSFSPAGYGSISGADEDVTQLRKSTIVTATPWLAIIRPQA